MITKTDCFAFDENKCYCKVLDKLYCQKERKKYGGVK